MYKLFSRSKAATKPLQSSFEIEQENDARIASLVKQMDDVYLGVKGLKARNIALELINKDQDAEVISLKAIVANLRKQKVYSGQRFYNPKDHKAPIVYLCARWNEWYMIRWQNEASPLLISQATWDSIYSDYELMPKSNTNLKNLS